MNQNLFSPQTSAAIFTHLNKYLQLNGSMEYLLIINIFILVQTEQQKVSTTITSDCVHSWR